MRVRLALALSVAAVAALPVLPSHAASCAARGSSTVVTPKGLTAPLTTPGQPVAGSANGADTASTFQLDLSSLKGAKSAPVKVAVSWGSAASDFDVVVSDRFGLEYGRGTVRNAAEQRASEVVVTAPIGSCEEFVVTTKNTAGSPSEALSATLSVGDPTTPKAPALSRKGWVSLASPNGIWLTGGGEDPAQAFDGDLKTRWSTGMQQMQTAFYALDLGGEAQTFNRLVMETGSLWSADRPLEYVVEVSNDNAVWSTVAGGVGAATTEARFPTQTARYVRVRMTTATYPNYWSLAELNLYKDCFSKKAGC